MHTIICVHRIQQHALNCEFKTQHVIQYSACEAIEEMQAKKESILFRVAEVDAELASIQFCSSQPLPTTDRLQKVPCNIQADLTHSLFPPHSQPVDPGDPMTPLDIHNKANCALTAFTERYPSHDAATTALEWASRAMGPCTAGGAPCGTRAGDAAAHGTARGLCEPHGIKQMNSITGDSRTNPSSAKDSVLCGDCSAQVSAATCDAEVAASSTDPAQVVATIQRGMREAENFLAAVGGPEVRRHLTGWGRNHDYYAWSSFVSIVARDWANQHIIVC